MVQTKEYFQELFVKGYKPSQQNYTDLFDTMFAQGGQWEKKTKILSNDDVKALATANDGRGFKMEGTYGSTAIRQIANPIILFDESIVLSDKLEIYSDQGITGLYQTLLDHNPSQDWQNLPLGFMQGIGGYASSDSPSYHFDDTIFIYSDADFTSYIGSAILIYDVRTLDFSA